jgi:phospholipid/cholesterol/gamma-HCH transport system substrate-binding protein
MLKAKTPLLVGFLVIAAVAAFIFTFGTLDRGMDMDEAYTVFARFDDASGLAPGSRISLAGIEVGVLGTPALDPDEPAMARVPLIIRKDVVLRQGVWNETKQTWVNAASAVRRQSSLIGDYDVALTPGLEGEIIPPGGYIPNVTGEAGLSAVIKTLENSSKVIFPALEKISDDIEAITGALRDAIGDEHGQRALEKIRTDVEKTTDNVQKLTAEMRNFLAQRIYPRGDNLERILINLERTSTELARASVTSTERLDKILERVERVTMAIGKFVDDQTAAPEDAKDGTIAKTLAGLDKSMALIEGSLENIRSVTENIEQGRGTIGRLLTDDKLITDIERVIADVEGFTSTFSRTQIKVQFRADYYVGRSAYKSTVDFALHPGPDKHYLFQLIDDPVGKATRRLRVTTTNDPRLPPVLVEEISETSGDFKFTAQFAKRFHFLTFRYGVMESTGGLGVDADLLDDSLGFKLDVFEFGRDQYPRLRLMAQWEFVSHFFLSAGIDDMLNAPARDWFVGLGVRFIDEDIKGVLPFTPSP